jgi:DNA-binding response OmpR family regulator
MLLVDDEPAIRLAVRKWFERNGWVVDEADNGTDACALLDAVHMGYGLVICDVHLPGTSGFAIAAKVEAQWPELLARFVFTTGDNLEFTDEQRQLRDRTHVLLKPFEFSELRTLISTVTSPVS